MESRAQNRAPSHSSWKTPMNPAFPTPPTASTSDPETELSNNPNRYRLSTGILLKTVLDVPG